MNRFSILIPTYKEKERVFYLIKTILRDKLKNKIEKIVVVTPDKNLTLPKSRKILLIKEKERRGKYYAIRIGLRRIKTKIVVMLSSDLLIKENFLGILTQHFKDPSVGMVVGRPIADRNSSIYPFSKIIWSLHHLICLKKPKGTEICAFRKVLNSLPPVSADEVYIEYRIRKAGYRIIYEPQVFGYTKTPNSLISFFKQRKRVAVGHFIIRKKYKFSTSSLDYKTILWALFVFVKDKKNIKYLLFLPIVLFIEVLARLLALVEAYLLNKDCIIWKR